MPIEDPEELKALRRAGAVVAATLRALRPLVRPGVTTGELDRAAARIFERNGARSGPQLDYDFPGAICISVDAEAVHGIPGPRRLREGQLVKLDVTAELDGFYADACETVPVGRVDRSAGRLASVARAAMREGISAAVAGAPLNAIGTVVAQRTEAAGFSVCRELTGHGIGRKIHEPPHVPNHYVRSASMPLRPGLVITVEPIIAAGDGNVVSLRDGWTIRTADGSRSAHAEHTIVVAEAGPPIVLTA
jgi:methionyl aminopeptidase